MSLVRASSSLLRHARRVVGPAVAASSPCGHAGTSLARAPAAVHAQAWRRCTTGAAATSVGAVRGMCSYMANTIVPVSGGEDRRTATGYRLEPEEIEAYHRDGYLSLDAVCTPEEMEEIEVIYQKLITGEVPIPGKDFCDVTDMSQAHSVPQEEWRLVNAMLPRVYYPPLQGNVYELRCADIVRQLFNADDMVIDYDQFLAKKPQKDLAVFAWHQDLAYWPVTEDTRTATFSLAIDTTTQENGCLNFVTGSHHEKELRNHRPFAQSLKETGEAEGTTREDAHALQVHLNNDDEITAVPIPRGGVSIHNEKVLHGSGGNFTEGWRRTYVLAYRSAATVKWERDNGFTHSHNDDFNWDKFHSWQDATH